MRDLIDRQALIKELHRWDMQDLYLPAHFQHLIEDAPSAETYVIADEIELLRAERDAAVADLKMYGSCGACKYGNIVDGKKEDYVQALKKCKGCKPNDCRFEWRGVQNT